MIASMQALDSILIGLGEAGQALLPHLAALQGFRPAALVDPRAAATDAPGFSDWRVALEHTRASVAIINTPGHLHAEPIHAALQRNMHVLVAKPFVPTFDEAKSLVDLADRQRVTVCVIQQMRFNRHYRALTRAIASGMVGDVEIVHFANAKRRPDPLNLTREPHPILREQSVHHFDMLLALLPGRSFERIVVDGFSPSWSPYAGPSMINALLETDAGQRVLYHAGYSSHAPHYDIRIEGTRGALRCRGSHMSTEDAGFEFAAVGGKWQPIDLLNGEPATNAWTILLDQWHAFLAGGTEPAFSGKNNLRVMRLIDAAIASCESRLPVDIGGLS
jgi:predicted dehydrogenase